jgi:A/G-specific adenine glycosylase
VIMSNSGGDGRTNPFGFSQLVLQWFTSNGRDFPWRNTSNPYHIFVAEILLRRTQAERVVETYRKLIGKYPTPKHLSQANIQELRGIFRPLGLINRANLLIEAATRIVDQYDGEIPSKINLVSTLPGMGIYSSRAVVCLAFREPVPMIDESSGRLIRRVLNLEGKLPAYSDRQLLQTATALIPAGWAREFNLGLLDIASAFCHHNVPDCLNCPLRSVCSYCHKTFESRKSSYKHLK